MKDWWNEVKISHPTKPNISDFHHRLKTSYLGGAKGEIGTPSTTI
jgi:hypothetical protein